MLLRIERKGSKGVTAYLWIPTLWFSLIFTKSIGSWLGTGGATIEEGSKLDQLFGLGLFFVALVVMIRRRFAWAAVILQYKWVFLLLGFCLISTVWSQIPLISLRRWISGMIGVVIILSVQTEPQPLIAIQSILRRVVYIFIFPLLDSAAIASQ